MKGKDEIKDLFSDKLGGFEVPVRPELWTNIASQIGSGSTVAAAKGMSLLTKTIISVGVIGTAVVTTIFLITPNTETRTKVKVSEPVSEPIITEPIAVLKETKDINRSIEKKQEETSTKENVIAIPVFEPKEIDQSKNFKSDVSIVKGLKERIESTPPEKSEKGTETLNSYNKNKNKEENITPSDTNKLTTEDTKTGESGALKAFTLGELPNIFTPNGDGNNDILFIESEGLIDFTIVVLDVNQKVVFESNNPDFKWNGIDKLGNIVSPGSYGYYIIARDAKGNKVNRFISLEIRF